MTPSQNCVDLIKSFEGLRLEPYQDSVGLWTVGYGHRTNLPSPITQAIADQYFAHDIGHAAALVDEYCDGELAEDLNQNQYDALVSMCFNLGRAPFMNSDGTKTGLYNLLIKGFPLAAADSILEYDHAGGKVIPGLLHRREAEKALFLTPIQGQG